MISPSRANTESRLANAVPLAPVTYSGFSVHLLMQYQHLLLSEHLLYLIHYPCGRQARETERLLPVEVETPPIFIGRSIRAVFFQAARAGKVARQVPLCSTIGPGVAWMGRSEQRDRGRIEGRG